MTDVRREVEAALRQAGLPTVSRETSERLIAIVDLLREWSRAQNLVGPSALNEIWTRHVADSAQLCALAPEARRWLDIGSGAGFPGLVVAALLAGTRDSSVTLVESNERKCAFLREAGRVAGLPIEVHHARIEDALPASPVPEIVTARALAPVSQLLEWITPMLQRGAVALLHKGLDFDRERSAIAHPERFDLVLHESRIGPGVVVEAHARTSN